MPPGREHGRLLANPAACIQNGELAIAVSVVRQCRNMGGQIFLKNLQTKASFQGIADLLAKATREAVEISVHAVLKMMISVAECLTAGPAAMIDHVPLLCAAVQQDIKEALIKS